ncbi:hypothetical protein [Microbacterium sp. LMI1-1-1.1]|uniref:hypothetical protein n=1 Tax=Microbacterium sp. LMI1-1-1.1 TaxID=3135223 RepID=UPI0034663B30
MTLPRNRVGVPVLTMAVGLGLLTAGMSGAVTAAASPLDPSDESAVIRLQVDVPARAGVPDAATPDPLDTRAPGASSSTPDGLAATGGSPWLLGGAAAVALAAIGAALRRRPRT